MSEDKKLKSSSSSLSNSDLSDVSGGMANPIYTKYFKGGRLMNPDTGKPFESEKAAWEHFRAHNPPTAMPRN